MVCLCAWLVRTCCSLGCELVYTLRVVRRVLRAKEAKRCYGVACKEAVLIFNPGTRVVACHDILISNVNIMQVVTCYHGTS